MFRRLSHNNIMLQVYVSNGSLNTMALSFPSITNPFIASEIYAVLLYVNC